VTARRCVASAVLVAVLAALARLPAGADTGAADETVCDRLATTTAKRTQHDFRIMSGACANAAAWYRHRAALSTGPPRQQELILEAAYLYFTAEAQAGAHRVDRAVAILKDSRKVYLDVLNHALTDDARHKAQMGLRVVDLALAPASSGTR
jgi:hypothetical protein